MRSFPDRVFNVKDTTRRAAPYSTHVVKSLTMIHKGKDTLFYGGYNHLCYGQKVEINQFPVAASKSTNHISNLLT